MTYFKIKELYGLVVGMAFLLVGNLVLAGPAEGQKKGYIQNDRGDKCWYTQVLKEKNTYFHKGLTGTNGVITFDDPVCMSDDGLGLEFNKGMINNAISRWYSHRDAKFQTRTSEMFSGSFRQVRGGCIQSKTYTTIGITVDYFIKNNSIIGVIHGSSVGECTN